MPRLPELTTALLKAKEGPKRKILKPKSGNVMPCFNGSQTSKRNKKRPITLPERA